MMPHATEADERYALWNALLIHALALVREMQEHIHHGRIEAVHPLEETFLGLSAELEQMDAKEIAAHEPLLNQLHSEVTRLHGAMIAQRDVIITQLEDMGSVSDAVKAYVKSSLVLPPEHE